jgi:hypothetical protein
MKKLTLTLLSIIMGLLLSRYYSIVPRKMLVEYIMAVYLSIRFINNDEGKLITVENNFKKQ